MIDKKLIEENQKILAGEQKRLQMLIARIAKPSSDVPGEFEAEFPNYGDKDDENASEVAAYEASIAEEKDLHERLRLVEAALDRITKGTYGVCLVGGEEMTEERLRAVPEAENCTKHAT